MTPEVDFLLIGGGLASATAAKILREQGAEGAVVILAAESLLPYHRPPLTKGLRLLTCLDRDTPARGLSDRSEGARPRGGTARLKAVSL